MKYLRKFDTYQDYKDYLAGDDIWLPRVSLIVNGQTPHDETVKIDAAGNTAVRKRYNVSTGKLTETDKAKYTWVDFSRIGTEFIEIANGGIMYFTDQIYGDIEYKAFIEYGALCITSRNIKTGELTNDASIVDGQIRVKYVVQ